MSHGWFGLCRQQTCQDSCPKPEASVQKLSSFLATFNCLAKFNYKLHCLPEKRQKDSFGLGVWHTTHTILDDA